MKSTRFSIIKNSLPSLALATGTLFSAGVAADELNAEQAYSVSHGEQTIVTYYTEAADNSYQVVTTIGSTDSSMPSVRYQATLLPGQQQQINFANADDSVLTISRNEDAVNVELSARPVRFSMID